MYKFMHFSDTHLGRKHPSEITKERVESSIKALEYCVNEAVKENVDFVLHSGDLFDTVYPWHTVIEAAKNKTKPLRDNNIPLYVIRGNHDRSYGQGRKLKGIATEHLDFENVHIIDPSPNEFPEKGYEDFNEDIRIYGLGYHASRTPEILSGANFKDNKFNILLLHDFVEGVTRSFSDNVTSADMLADKNLDYVGIGHDHEANPKKEIGTTFFSAPGGTIDYDFNTTEFGKTYNIVKVKDGQIDSFENFNVPQTLELVKIDFEIDEFNREIVLNRVEEYLDDDIKYGLKLRIFGEISEDEERLQITSITESVEENFSQVLSCGAIDNTVLEGMKSFDVENGEDKFDVEKYIKSHLEEEVGGKFVLLHEAAEGLLSNEENLTSTGFNLDKSSRVQLEKKVEEVLFD